MRSNLPFILDRLALNAAESGTTVTLRWTQLSEVTEDPVTQAKLGVPTPMTAAVRGFVHFPSATSAVRMFTEVQVGDCLLDLPAEVELEGLDGLVFEIDGERWLPKAVGEKLAAHWDVLVNDQRLYRTVLLRKAT